MCGSTWKGDRTVSQQRVPTVRDVAARAGVSVGTVSKALNNRGQLREETRARVVAAARELGFRPNTLAQSLQSGRTFTVAVITTDRFGRFGNPLMLGVEDALGADRVSVFLCDTREDPIREHHHAETLDERRVDGIIVAGRRKQTRPPLAVASTVPVVYVIAQSSDPSDFCVTTDDVGGGVLAARHLLASGRTRIGHITGPERFADPLERAAGLQSVLDSAGLGLAGGQVFYGEWSEDWGRRAAEMLLHAAPDTDAVFCGSDQIARGVVETLRDRRLRVPGDIAVVGFDNWEPMAAGCRPPLTTVDPNLREVGRVAATRLLDMIAGRPVEGGVETVPAWLMLRESTGVRLVEP
jgi:LacI family transcriptional regulator